MNRIRRPMTEGTGSNLHDISVTKIVVGILTLSLLSSAMFIISVTNWVILGFYHTRRVLFTRLLLYYEREREGEKDNERE